MSISNPQLADILTAAVSTLREDDELAGLLYPDTPPPAEKRMRVHEAYGGPADIPPIEVTVQPVASGTQWRGGVMSDESLLQCSVIATRDWVGGHTVMGMYDIRQVVKNSLVPSVATAAYPTEGSGGREGVIEVPSTDAEGSGRLLLPVDIGVETHHLTD